MKINMKKISLALLLTVFSASAAALVPPRGKTVDHVIQGQNTITYLSGNFLYTVDATSGKKNTTLNLNNLGGVYPDLLLPSGNYFLAMQGNKPAVVNSKNGQLRNYLEIQDSYTTNEHNVVSMNGALFLHDTTVKHGTNEFPLLQLVNLNTGKVLKSTELTMKIDDRIALSPDGRMVAMIAKVQPQQEVYVLSLVNAQTGKLIKQINLTNLKQVTGSVSFSHNGRKLLFLSENKPVVLDIQTEAIKPISASGFTDLYRLPLFFLANDQYLVRPVTAGNTVQLVLYNVQTGQVQKQQHTFTEEPLCSDVSSYGFSPDNRWIALGHKCDYQYSGNNSYISIWDGLSGKWVRTLAINEGI